MLTSSAEFQIPQQVARYASFMFSFLGRGICKHLLLSVIQLMLNSRSLHLHRIRHCWREVVPHRPRHARWHCRSRIRCSGIRPLH